MTEFYKRPETRGLSTPMQHALAFKHLMETKTVCLNDGELIVGERGPAPKATPTYPEVCIHSVQDLQYLNDRKKTAFGSDEETRRVYAEEIIPFWQGRSQRDRIFAEMTKEWIDAYEAGIFTEFMEQRAPGHTVLDGKIYRKGMNDFKTDIAAALAGLDFMADPDAYDKQEELKAMAASCDAVIAFARRHADKARELAEPGEGRREEDGARAHRRGLRPRAGRGAARFLGGPPGLLVRPPRASSPSTTPGTPSTRAGSTSTSGRSIRKAWPTAR